MSRERLPPANAQEKQCGKSKPGDIRKAEGVQEIGGNEITDMLHAQYRAGGFEARAL